MPSKIEWKDMLGIATDASHTQLQMHCICCHISTKIVHYGSFEFTATLVLSTGFHGSFQPTQTREDLLANKIISTYYKLR